jgi:hypothetical protein
MQEPVTTSQWVVIAQKLLPYLGGGAFGALITLVATWYKNRRQPIGYKIETIEIFKEDPYLPSLQAILSRISGSEEGDDEEELAHNTIVLKNLSVARITLVNKGNQDHTEFRFGVTFAEGDTAIDLRTEALDRHHIAKSLTKVDITNEQREIDFSLTPFNRGDKYLLSIYFTYKVPDQPIELSTPHPVRFVEIGAMSQTALGVATEVLAHTTPFGASISLIRRRD